MEKEDGVMSDDAMSIDNKDESDCTVGFKAHKSGLVVQQLDKIDAKKIEERANRFGLNLTGNRIVTQKQIDELYTNSGIEEGNERHFRFDTLHMYGVDGLTTKEIFEYLEDYKPVSLEWVNDLSCNIICQDHISAALALLVHSREIKTEELKDILSKNNFYWREAMPHPKKDLILVRFATNSDKKASKKKNFNVMPNNTNETSKNPWGDLCQTWGVYDHQEIFARKLKQNSDVESDDEPPKSPKIKNKQLAMRLGKRQIKRENISDDEDSSDEWKRKSKTPRMRMHADDEETKRKLTSVDKNEPVDDIQDNYAPLSIEIVNSWTSYAPKDNTILSKKFNNFEKKADYKSQKIIVKDSIRSRLGVMVKPSNVHDKSSDECESSNEDNEQDHNIMSKVQKVFTSSREKPPSVWSRLDYVQNNSNNEKDLRQRIKLRKPKQTDDLRDKLGKAKRSQIRIEIDNN